jgi:hypothetical protein
MTIPVANFRTTPLPFQCSPSISFRPNFDRNHRFKILLQMVTTIVATKRWPGEETKTLDIKEILGKASKGAVQNV